MPRLTLVLLLVLFGTTPAAAQSPAKPRDQSIGAAAHWALPHPRGNVRPGVQGRASRDRRARREQGAE